MIFAITIVYLIGFWMTYMVCLPTNLDIQRAVAAAVFWPIVLPYAVVRYGAAALRWLLQGLWRLR